MIYGYLRVSRADLNSENQRLALAQYNVDQWFSDEAVSGSISAVERPGFQALLSALAPGDTLIVNAVDRLGRNMLDVQNTVATLTERGIKIISQREGVDFSNSIGRMVLAVLAGVAELERENLRERTKLGIARAKAQGKLVGRGKSYTPEQIAEVKALFDSGMKGKEVAEATGFPLSTVYALRNE